MKTDWTHLEGARVSKAGYRSDRGDTFGMFVVFLESGVTLVIIAVAGMPGRKDPMEQWDHVSCHARTPSVNHTHRQRTPTWDEMCHVKNLFWDPDECVVQFHPAESEYVNTHPNVLHLWKHVDVAFPTPPMLCV